ncbi:MAG: hypothetical protein RIR79_141 [Pseudomonadota bacterium]|jgi:CRISPR-associated protein Csm4
MQIYRFILRPLTAFGTPLAGDTLFGQLCWTLRHQLGNTRLTELLQGYTEGRPFAVVSDAFPTGHIPLPNVQSKLWEKDAQNDRKALKKKRWLPVDSLSAPFPQWQAAAKSDKDISPNNKAQEERAQPHNTINRMTGTTGEGAFAPYSMSQIWFAPDMRFDVVVVLDETRLGLEELTKALKTIGQTGFGRDASIGLGKFVLEGDAIPVQWHKVEQPNSYLTLAPCAPQGLGFCPVRSTYQVITRFGRHGDAAVQSGNPFKRPVLLAKAGGVFWAESVDSNCSFIGQGLGGNENPISEVMKETVQQGYSPVIPIHAHYE